MEEVLGEHCQVALGLFGLLLKLEMSLCVLGDNEQGGDTAKHTSWSFLEFRRELGFRFFEDIRGIERLGGPNGFLARKSQRR